MATKTTAQTGLWSDTATWTGGVIPASGDICNVNHNVTFDVNMSSFSSGLSSLTIGNNSTLTVLPSSYIYMNGMIVGSSLTTSHLVIGSSGSPIPFSSGVTVKINGGNYIDGNSLDLQIFGETVANPVCYTTEVATSGATVFTVDRNLTSSAGWVEDALVYVSNSTTKDKDRQIFAISSITSTTITIKAAPTFAGCIDTLYATTNKTYSVGSVIALANRAIKIIGGGTSYYDGTGTTSRAFTSGIGSSMLSGIMCSRVSYGYYYCSCNIHNGVNAGCSTGNQLYSGTVTQGLNVGCSNGNNYCTGVISNVINVGCAYGNAYCTGKMSDVINVCCTYGNSNCGGSIVTGSNIGCNYGNYYCCGILDNCSNSYCVYGSTLCNGARIIGGTNSNNTRDFYQCQHLELLINVVFGNTVDFYYYNAIQYMGLWGYVESINHGNVAGSFKSWSVGGVTISNTSVVPPCKAISYQSLCESATYYCFKQNRRTIKPNETVKYNCYIRKDVSMSYLPRIQFVNVAADPLIESGDNVISEAIMTNSTNSWELLTLEYKNTSSQPLDIFVRVISKNANGNVYTYTEEVELKNKCRSGRSRITGTRV